MCVLDLSLQVGVTEAVETNQLSSWCVGILQQTTDNAA
jgi:hypothetical protein